MLKGGKKFRESLVEVCLWIQFFLVLTCCDGQDDLLCTALNGHFPLISANISLCLAKVDTDEVVIQLSLILTLKQKVNTSPTSLCPCKMFSKRKHPVQQGHNWSLKHFMASPDFWDIFADTMQYCGPSSPVYSPILPVLFSLPLLCNGFVSLRTALFKGTEWLVLLSLPQVQTALLSQSHWLTRLS